MGIKNQLKALGTLFILLVISGCAQVGNFLVTPHPNSLQKVEKVKLTTEKPGIHRELAPAVASGIVLAGEQLLQKEAEKYSASYSASGTFKDIQELKEIYFNSSGSVGLSVDAELSDEDKTIEKKSIKKFAAKMKITDVKVYGFKSKVPCWTWMAMFRGDGANIWKNQSGMQRAYNIFGLINPFMVLHAIYSVFDDDIYKVHVAIRTKIDAVAPNIMQPTLANVADVTFDLGKVSIFHTKDILKTTESGKFAIPVPGVISNPPIAQPTLPGNITMTVVEADDFGDLIGKAAKTVGDKKDSIADGLKKVMGIK